MTTPTPQTRHKALKQNPDTKTSPPLKNKQHLQSLVRHVAKINADQYVTSVSTPCGGE